MFYVDVRYEGTSGVPDPGHLNFLTTCLPSQELSWMWKGSLCFPEAALRKQKRGSLPMLI
jgi:hypothetical protein